MYYNTKVDKYWIITQKTKKHLRFFETTSNNLHSKCVSKTSKKNIKKQQQQQQQRLYVTNKMQPLYTFG